MRYVTRVATIDGWPVYRDYSGDLVIESNGFQNLRYLTDEEEAKLSTISRQLKNLVVTDKHAK